jgi:hypothetical protein
VWPSASDFFSKKFAAPEIASGHAVNLVFAADSFLLVFSRIVAYQDVYKHLALLCNKRYQKQVRKHVLVLPAS